MDDLISRQAAIDFIDAGHLCNPNEPRWSDNEVVNFLKSRPSAQPELIEKTAYIRGFEQGKTQGMIDAKLELTCNQLATDCITAQTEIIRCKDCKHMQEDKIFTSVGATATKSSTMTFAVMRRGKRMSKRLIYAEDAIEALMEILDRPNHAEFLYTDEICKVLEHLPSIQPEIIRCRDCRWGREVCGNIECFVDSNIPPEYHGYEWFCPNGERRPDE